MSEFVFTVKCLVLSALLVLVAQVKFNGFSLEQRLDESLRNSRAISWLEEAGAGGALAIRQGWEGLRSDDGEQKPAKIEQVERAGR